MGIEHPLTDVLYATAESMHRLCGQNPADNVVKIPHPSGAPRHLRPGRGWGVKMTTPSNLEIVKY